MEQLLEKARLVFGEQDWSAWEWSAKEYGTPMHRTICLRYEGGAFVRVAN